MVQPLVRVERGGIDGVQPGQQGLKRGLTRQVAGAAGVGQARQGVTVAVHARADRIDAAEVAS